jgi:CubicO group peptidase (beta-lactamase class C family)
MIHGSVRPGFEAVETEFRCNFAERGELGAACAIYHRGEKVVDLWGGYRDAKTRAPWEQDTLVSVMSTTKGLAAMAVALAHSRGLLDYDEVVATYWSEFGQNGKEAVTVRQLLAHQAGVCAIDEPIDLKTIADHERLAAILARQKPAWEPGTKQGYHMWNLGWYESELIRRVDPKHRSIGQFFQDEIAVPLDLEFYIGLPAHVPDLRIANWKDADFFRLLANLDKLKHAQAYLNPFKADTLTVRTMKNPKVLLSFTNYNERDLRSVEVPSANGIGQVRSMAKAYSVFATGGRGLGLNKETLSALCAPAIPPASGSFYDEVLLTTASYALGFTKPSEENNFGTSDQAFGFGGAGGSLAFADPDTQTGYAYAPNQAGVYPFGDPREKALRDAYYACLEKLRFTTVHFLP